MNVSHGTNLEEECNQNKKFNECSAINIDEISPSGDIEWDVLFKFQQDYRKKNSTRGKVTIEDFLIRIGILNSTYLNQLFSRTSPPSTTSGTAGFIFREKLEAFHRSYLSMGDTLQGSAARKRKSTSSMILPSAAPLCASKKRGCPTIYKLKQRKQPCIGLEGEIVPQFYRIASGGMQNNFHTFDEVVSPVSLITKGLKDGATDPLLHLPDRPQLSSSPPLATTATGIPNNFLDTINVVPRLPHSDEEKADTTTSDDWSCSLCTFFNDSSLNKCAICNTQNKGSREARPIVHTNRKKQHVAIAECLRTTSGHKCSTYTDDRSPSVMAAVPMGMDLGRPVVVLKDSVLNEYPRIITAESDSREAQSRAVVVSYSKMRAIANQNGERKEGPVAAQRELEGSSIPSGPRVQQQLQVGGGIPLPPIANNVAHHSSAIRLPRTLKASGPKAPASSSSSGIVTEVLADSSSNRLLKSIPSMPQMSMYGIEECTINDDVNSMTPIVSTVVQYLPDRKLGQVNVSTVPTCCTNCGKRSHLFEDCWYVEPGHVIIDSVRTRNLSASDIRNLLLSSSGLDDTLVPLSANTAFVDALKEVSEALSHSHYVKNWRKAGQGADRVLPVVERRAIVLDMGSVMGNGSPAVGTSTISDRAAGRRKHSCDGRE